MQENLIQQFEERNGEISRESLTFHSEEVK